ncbi:hypothetical protein BBF96_04145 [Anoxybacter fermentans]|uniref:NodB homology domain-containing protein n=1 Tax=Anoxybacter fermentans TaxID=1323375 RepID=A0A3Q9HPC5_9FIRM|nr:polysaccharide deacetylase family protein [Anoxybacter fermentans]AZR72650.1 hypothetical protein BBF96_04145 [Anoxybacter fermentans]
MKKWLFLAKTMFILIIAIGSLNISAIAEEESKITEQQFRVLLHFDDSYTGVYKNAFPLLESYGYKGTIFVPTNFIDRPNHMSLEQLIELKEAGWEIGSHSRSHQDLKELDLNALYDEIVGSRNVLVAAKLITLDNAYFCSPMTVWNSYIEALVKNNYRAARTEELIIFGVKEQPHQYTLVMLKNTSLNIIEYWIKRAKNENAWLIMIFHEIAEDGNKYYFSPVKLKQVLDLLKKYGAKISTIQEAINEWEEIIKNKKK